MTTIPTSTDDLEALEAESLLARFTGETQALGDLLARAREVQWTAPPRTTLPAERKGVGHKPSAPTEDIALDGQRLALRVNVLASERALRQANLYVTAIRRHLEEALRPYEE
jgi:hypothetical protein